MKKVRLQLKFSEQFVRNLKASAAAFGMTPSELVWEAYREWSIRHEGPGRVGSDDEPGGRSGRRTRASERGSSDEPGAMRDRQ